LITARSEAFQGRGERHLITSMLNSINLGQHLAAPEFVEPSNSCEDLELIGRFSYVREIDREYIGAVDIVDVATARATRSEMP
jgi:hypothetical protein